MVRCPSFFFNWIRSFRYPSTGFWSSSDWIFNNSSLLVRLFHSLYHFLCVFGSLPCWNTLLHPRPNLLADDSCFPEEFGDNPPSTLLHLPSMEQQIHCQQNSLTFFLQSNDSGGWIHHTAHSTQIIRFDFTLNYNVVSIIKFHM